MPSLLLVMWLELTWGVVGMWLEPVNMKKAAEFPGNFCQGKNGPGERRVCPELLAEPHKDQGGRQAIPVDPAHLLLLLVGLWLEPQSAACRRGLE
jgi:hypothetical protein